MTLPFFPGAGPVTPKSLDTGDKPTIEDFEHTVPSSPIYTSTRPKTAFDEYSGKFVSIVDSNLVSGSSDIFRNSIGGYFYNIRDEDGLIVVPPAFTPLHPFNVHKAGIYSVTSFTGEKVNNNIELKTGIGSLPTGPGGEPITGPTDPGFIPEETTEASFDVDYAPDHGVRNQETILPYVKFVCNIEGDPTYEFLQNINTGNKYWEKLIIGGEFNERLMEPVYEDSIYDYHYTAINTPYEFIDKRILTSGPQIRKFSEIGYDYNIYDKTYQNTILSLESVKEAPNWYILYLLSLQDTGFDNQDIIDYYKGDNTPLEMLAREIIQPDSGSMDGLNTINQNMASKEVTLKSKIRDNQTNLLFNSNGVRTLFNQQEATVNNFKHLMPYYTKFNLNTESSGEFVRLIQQEDYSTGFLRNLKEVFLQQTENKLPLEPVQAMINTRFLESTSPKSKDTLATSSETTSFRSVDFMEFLLYSYENIKCQYSDFTIMDTSTLQAKAAYDKVGSYRTLNVRDTLRVINQTLSKFTTDANAFYVSDINTLMNLQDHSKPYTAEDLDIVSPELKYNEVLAYRIEKIGGSVSGDSNTQSVIQNFWIFNDSKLEDLNMIDLQVKYGAEYTYKIYAYYLIKGVKYKFSDLQMTRIVGNVKRDGVVASDSDASTGVDSATTPDPENPIVNYCVEYYNPYTGEIVKDLLNGIIGTEDSTVESSVALEDTLRLRKSKKSTDEVTLPPYIANFVTTVQPSLKIVEIPIHQKEVLLSDYVPNVVNVDPSFVLNNSNKLIFNLSYQAFSEADELFPDLVDVNRATFRDKYLNSNDLTITLGLDKESVSPARYVDVYRIEHMPTSYEDFNNNLISTLDKKVEDKNFAYRSCIFRDIVKSNTKYYYLFKTRNELGVPGHNSQILEAELINDGGYKYASFELVTKEDMQVDKFKNISDRFRSVLEIVPNQTQLTLDDSAVDYSNTAKSQYDRVKVGIADELVWNKTFKLRLTSKKTGKKIDLNITYSDPSVNLEE